MSAAVRNALLGVTLAGGAFCLGMLFQSKRQAPLSEVEDEQFLDVYREARSQGFYDALRREELEDDPQALDALGRWAEKNGVASYDPEDFAIRKMFIPVRNQGDGQSCISLAANPPSPSGTPVYCYRNETTDLVLEYSDVE